MAKRGRPPRDRKGEDRRAADALQQWQQTGGRTLFTDLTDEDRRELRSHLANTQQAVDEVTSA